MSNDKVESSKHVKAETVAERVKRKHELASNASSLIPWHKIIQWFGASIIAIVIVVGSVTYLTSERKPISPIDTSLCPVVKELIGRIDCTYAGKQLILKTGDYVPQGTTLQSNDMSTMQLLYPNGTTVSFYPNGKIRTDADYADAITLISGNLSVNAKKKSFAVKSRYGIGKSKNAIVHFELDNSRLHGECETGEMTLSDVKGNRVLFVVPTLPGEVGIGAKKYGIPVSEDMEVMNFPKLMIDEIYFINAKTDNAYSRSPMEDGYVFKRPKSSSPPIDFKVTTNSKNTKKLHVSIKKMELGGKLLLFKELDVSPIKYMGKMIFGVFGVKQKKKYLDFTGTQLPIGNYLMKITPFGPIRNGNTGKGRGTFIRFVIRQ